MLSRYSESRMYMYVEPHVHCQGMSGLHVCSKRSFSGVSVLIFFWVLGRTTVKNQN